MTSQSTTNRAHFASANGAPHTLLDDSELSFVGHIVDVDPNVAPGSSGGVCARPRCLLAHSPHAPCSHTFPRTDVACAFIVFALQIFEHYLYLHYTCPLLVFALHTFAYCTRIVDVACMLRVFYLHATCMLLVCHFHDTCVLLACYLYATCMRLACC